MFNPRGHIGFLGHGHELKFRNLFLKELDGSQAALAPQPNTEVEKTNSLEQKDNNAISQDYDEDIKKAEQSKLGWISLFNGKNFFGWRVSDNGRWIIKDGQIVANGPRSHLFTIQEFKNFIFKTEVKTTPGSNSGIYFHTKFQTTGFPNQGHEAQVNVTHRDPVKTGSLYNVVNRFKTPAKDNQWWTQTVIVNGRHIIIKVNDEVVVNYTEPKNVKGGSKGGRKLSQGSFALQAHDPGSAVYFRNIRVKRLPD